MRVQIIAVGSTQWEAFLLRWGISYLIGEDVLFDTFGDPLVFLRNIKRMHIDPSGIRHIVISHDHWDHITGLWYLLEKNRNVSVYVCPDFSPESKERIRGFGVNLVEVRGLLRIKDTIYSTGQIDGTYKGKLLAEQALVIHAEGGLTVLTGCAHPGIVTILNEVRKDFPGQRISAVVGGFHLLGKGKAEIESIANQFRNMGILQVGPCHCSGSDAQRIFKDRFKKSFIPVKAKQSIEV